MAELRRQGKRISRRPPFGFRVVGKDLEPVAEEQAILRKMLTLHFAGAGPTAIACTLNSEELVNPRTVRNWTAGNVGTLLKTAAKRLSLRGHHLGPLENRRCGAARE